MSKFKLLNIVDSIFIAFIIFIITFAIVQFIIVNFALSFIISIIIASALIVITNYLSNKKTNNKILKQHEKEQAEINALNFQLYSTSAKLNLVKKLIDKSFNPKIVGSHIEWTKENIKHIAVVENCVNSIDENYLLNLLKSYIKKTNNLVIVCNDYDSKLKNIIINIKNIKIKFINKYDFYKICAKNNVIIKENMQISKDKIKIKEIFSNFFNYNHFKGFFTTGLILLFTSFIVPFTTYYFIFAIILLIFSLICKLNKIKINLNTDYF